jgi:hypothetical protein
VGGGGLLMAVSRYGEAAGQRQFNGETKVGTRHFDSTPSRQGRVTIGDEQRGSAPIGRRWLRAKAGGR